MGLPERRMCESTQIGHLLRVLALLAPWAGRPQRIPDGSQTAPRRSQTVPGRPKRLPDGPTTAPGCPQTAPGPPKLSPRHVLSVLHLCPSGRPETALRPFQTEPGCPQTVPGRPRTASGRPKTAPGRAQDAPRQPQDAGGSTKAQYAPESRARRAHTRLECAETTSLAGPQTQ